MAERGMRVDHSTIHSLGSPVLAAVAEAAHQAKAHGHRQEMNPMMGKGQARYTFTPVPSLAEQFEILAA